MNDWWKDQETTDRYVVDLIVDRMSTDQGWDEWEEYDAAYDGVPVALHRGEWWVTDSSGTPIWSTGVSAEEVEHVRTIGELASAMNLEPWSLAADYGWDGADWSLEYYAQRFPEVAQALREYEERRAEELREEREQRRMEREDQEIFEREEREAAAAERGETLIYAPPGITLEEAAEHLGMPVDSETVRLYATGMLDEAEAMRRAKIIRHRHEQTDYEDLLERGIDRETAREIIREDDRYET